MKLRCGASLRVGRESRRAVEERRARLLALLCVDAEEVDQRGGGHRRRLSAAAVLSAHHTPGSHPAASSPLRQRGRRAPQHFLILLRVDIGRSRRQPLTVCRVEDVAELVVLSSERHVHGALAAASVAAGQGQVARVRFGRRVPTPSQQATTAWTCSTKNVIDTTAKGLVRPNQHTSSPAHVRLARHLGQPRQLGRRQARPLGIAGQAIGPPVAASQVAGGPLAGFAALVQPRGPVGGVGEQAGDQRRRALAAAAAVGPLAAVCQGCSGTWSGGSGRTRSQPGTCRWHEALLQGNRHQRRRHPGAPPPASGGRWREKSSRTLQLLQSAVNDRLHCRFIQTEVCAGVGCAAQQRQRCQEQQADAAMRHRSCAVT